MYIHSPQITIDTFTSFIWLILNYINVILHNGITEYK